MRNKNNQRLKAYSINKNIRISLVIISIIILTGMLLLIYFAQKNQKFIDQKYPVYSYMNKVKVNYEVFMVPNAIYTEKSLGEGNIYIINLTDYIDTKFKYEFSGEQLADIQGTYGIVAVLEGYITQEKGTKTIWKKEYVLQPPTNFNGNNKTLTFEKKIPVNLKTYEEFINKAKEISKVDPDTKLTVTWNVAIKAKTDKGLIDEKLSPIMEIPLKGTYYEIKGNLSQEKKGAFEETKKVISPTYKSKITVYSVVAGLSLLWFLVMLIFTTSAVMQDPFKKKLKDIFKMHGDRIVALESEIAITSEKLIEVASIEDLVRIADDVGRPILFKGEVNSEYIKAFYVIDENRIYILKLDKEVLAKVTIYKTETDSIDV